MTTSTRTPPFVRLTVCPTCVGEAFAGIGFPCRDCGGTGCLDRYRRYQDWEGDYPC